jgi:hypothetical protein
MSIGLKPYSPKPFRITVPDATLLDLRRRLRDVHWPDEVAPGWDYGVDLQYLRSFVDYWRDAYDWRMHEARLNELAHYSVEIDSIDLHYVHVEATVPTQCRCCSRTGGQVRSQIFAKSFRC